MGTFYHVFLFFLSVDYVYSEQLVHTAVSHHLSGRLVCVLVIRVGGQMVLLGLGARHCEGGSKGERKAENPS